MTGHRRKHILRIRIDWSWGKPLYKIRHTDREISVWGRKNTDVQMLCSFNWDATHRYDIVQDDSLQGISVLLNDEVVAGFSPFGAIVTSKTVRCTIHTEEPAGNFVLSSALKWGLSKGQFSIFNTEGSRKCHWRIRGCAFGVPSAIMLVRQSCDQFSLPLFLAIAVSTLILRGSMNGA
jgi:hypothetical protein